MKITMLVSNHCSPDPRVTSEAEALVESGNKVIILAWDRGKRFKKKEILNRVRIKRFGVKSTYGKSIFQLPSFLLFNFNLLYNLIFSKFDTVHCHDFDTLIPGFIAAKLKNKKIVYDAHESYSAMMYDKGLKRLSKLISWIESFLVKRVNLVISVNPVLADIFWKKRAKKIKLIMNTKRLDEFKINNKEIKKIRSNLGVKNRKLFVYIGMLIKGRNILNLIDIFKNRKDAFLVLGGEGKLENAIKKQIQNCNNIKFIGLVPFKEVIRYSNAADVVIAIYSRTFLNNDIAGPPNKLFEAIAAGKPIIASDRGSTGRIIKDCKCGIMVNADNKEDIKKAIDSLIKNKKQYNKVVKNSKKAQKEFNWKNTKKELIKVYKEI